MADIFLDIRLRDLHFFERLASLGSLTAVAQELRLPKATVSRWLTDLESRVGAPLAKRTTRVLALTPQGIELARRARVLLGQADATRMALLPDAPTGVLRVSVPVPLGRMLAGAVIARFRRRLPLVRLEIVLQNQRVDLLRDGVDVAIRGGELQDSDLIARKLASTSMWLYGSAAYRSVPLSDIPLIAAPADEALLRRAGIVVSDAAAIVDDRTAIADAIACGAGMGLLPGFLGEPARGQEKMVLLHEAPIVKLPVHAVFHSAQRDDVRVKVLVEEVEAQLLATL
ncbi:MAG: LysR family transcriptional regulator [Myxococcales bacterium]|nr:LysR family transcriptional regulator [Myxococcales bacterium]